MTASSTSPVADSVRLAWPAEAEQITALQRRSWLQTMPPEAAQALTTGLTAAEMATTWRQAIERPPEAACRVLVAVEQQRVVGFATTVPSTDSDTDRVTDGEVDQFVVDPAAQRRGHGSRLLNAVADTLRADGFVRAVWWVGAADDTLRAFLSAAGWAADGGYREIGSEDATVRLRQVRLHTSLLEPS